MQLFFVFTLLYFDDSNQTASSSVNLMSKSQNFCPNFKFHWGRCCGHHVVASLQASEIPQEQLLVFLYPGLPTTAELFILPDERTSSLHKKSDEVTLETVRVKTCQRVSTFSTIIPRNFN